MVFFIPFYFKHRNQKAQTYLNCVISGILLTLSIGKMLPDSLAMYDMMNNRGPDSRKNFFSKYNLVIPGFILGFLIKMIFEVFSI